MISIALAHHHAAPGFNGLFYATAATVIPVLFLALAVQGDYAQNTVPAIAQGTVPAARQAHEARRKAGLPPRIARDALIYGVIGEIIALIVLYLQKGDDITGIAVLAAPIWLLLAVANDPLVALTAFRIRHKRQRAAREPAEPGHAPPASPPSPEPGKTDAARGTENTSDTGER